MPRGTDLERAEVRPSFHLGGSAQPGTIASGSVYANKSTRAPHTYCWMRLAVFENFPNVPSLTGTRIQNGESAKDAAEGAGERIGPLLTLRFELFDDESPKTCANFRRLCNGQSNAKQPMKYCFQQIQASYKGTYFHKIIPHLCAQGGDISMRVNNGYNYHSSAGRGWFEDENKKRRHNEEGLLSMANNGPNSNGTQFFITTSNSQEKVFNGRHVCFGRVVEGYDDFRREVSHFGNVEGHPTRYVVVVDCGEGEVPPPLTQEELSAVEAATTAADEADDLAEAASACERTAVDAAVDQSQQKTGRSLDERDAHMVSGKWRSERERPCLGYGIPGY